MTTELSFLVDLLLNHKLPKATKNAVAERLKAVEVGMAPIPFSHRPGHAPSGPVALPAALQGQAASTQAALIRQMQDSSSNQVADQSLGPTPVAVVAQTPATQQALASRQQAIAESLAGKVDKTTGRPRKF